MELKKKFPKLPVFFICVNPSSELTESEQHARNSLFSSRRTLFQPHSYHDTSIIHHNIALKRRDSVDSRLGSTSLTLCQQLCNLGFISMLSPNLKKKLCRQQSGIIDVESKLIEDFDNFSRYVLNCIHWCPKTLYFNKSLYSQKSFYWKMLKIHIQNKKIMVSGMIVFWVYPKF